MARDWHKMSAPQWTETHCYDVLHSLERDVFPTLGNREIGDISATDVLDVLRAIEDRPAIETAKRVRQRISAVYYDKPAIRINDTALVETMAAISESFEAYGYRRMQAALRHRGLIVNHKKIGD
ncbi:phage integrase central domain-containing protein [Ancylobacter defluvii]|uniref:Uncharacterized protein n=1 Tax=Ancylobacter defluvii TaxID=1282440 RepID=A0A9W6K2L3_9HYPH|nr:IS3 family transposase [Ancylobacter defluvii]GLK86849.1 hypothetical protein GCM10017653_49190 [Ancylobacter defluvii]